jgi:hypothetical protein
VQGGGLACSADGVAACSAGGLASRRRPRVLGAVMCRRLARKGVRGGLQVRRRRSGGSAEKMRRRSSQATRSRGEDVAAFRLGSGAGVRAACVGRRRRSAPARGVGGGEARLGGRRVRGSGAGTAAVSSSGVGRASQRLLGSGIFYSFAD